MRPTFVVIGAAKCGTTSLCQLLGQHPEVFMTARKELHYFSFDRNFERGPGWYEAWFEGGAAFPQRGEGSASYTARKLFPRTAQRMATYDPGLKLVYIARDPLARIESAWQQGRRMGPASPMRYAGLGDFPDSMWVDNSFDRAVHRQVDVLVETTNYLAELALYRERFPGEQILVLLFEDLARDPRAVTRRCFEFLGVDPEVELADYSVRANAFGSYPVHRDFLRTIWASARLRRWSARAVDHLPRRLCERLSVRFLRVPLSERPRWVPETRAWVLSRLRGDLERFLEQHGYPRDAWTLE